MNQKWEIYTRGTIPLYRIAVFGHLRKAILSHNRDNFCDVLYACENGKLWWCWGKVGLEEWGKILMGKLNDRTERVKHYHEYERLCKKAIEAAEKIKGLDLSGLSNKEIVKIYDYLNKEISGAMGLTNIDLDVFDVVFESHLQKEIMERLEKKYPNRKEVIFSKIYSDLTTPTYRSYVTQEEEAMMRLAVKKEVSLKDIENIYGKFWWTSLGWENLAPRKPEYFSDKIKKYFRKKNLKKMISDLELKSSKILAKRKKIIAKYGLGRKVSSLLDVFDKFVCFHDLRKETQVKMVYAFNGLLEETAKRFNLKREIMEWYSQEEIIKILRGQKVNQKEIEMRKKAIVVLVEKDGTRMYSGKEAVKMRKRELEMKIDEVRELKGMGVSGGKVTAHVKVCSGIEEARQKIKKGDILVTGMTLPDYVPVMKISSAIITDEGGLTCHAAIVSRELGIPCIVGTRIATQVLHDGDLVEVDADNGTVKILKK